MVISRRGICSVLAAYKIHTESFYMYYNNLNRIQYKYLQYWLGCDDKQSEGCGVR